MKNKITSGSSRDKFTPTPRQNKWNDPFYCEARGNSKATHLVSHKVDSIRNSVSGENLNIFKSTLSAVSSFFTRIFKRKVIA